MLTLIIFIFLIKKFINIINKKRDFLLKDFFENNDLKIFLIGSYISLFCYIFFSNWSYREIFIILSISYLYKSSLILFNQKSFNYITILIISRYIFIFLYSYLNVNLVPEYIDGERIFSNYLMIVNFFKSMFDMILMSLIASMTIMETKKFFIIIKSYFKKQL